MSQAGPAGLLLNLLLARLGLSDSSRLCIDARPEAIKAGHADGLTPRTLEVLKSLNLFDEIFNHGRHIHELARWQRDATAVEGGLQRQFVIKLELGNGRYEPQILTMQQGRIGRIFEEDLRRYSARRVVRGSRLVDVKLDEERDATFPVVATIECEGKPKTVRTKYLVGADGAHSNSEAVSRHINGGTDDRRHLGRVGYCR